MHAGHGTEDSDLTANTFCDHRIQKMQLCDMLPLPCLTDLNEIDLIFCYLCIQSENFRIPARAFSIDGYERIRSGSPFREGGAPVEGGFRPIRYKPRWII